MKASWYPPNPGPLSEPTLTEFDKGCQAMAKAIIERYEALIEFVDAEGLSDAWEKLRREALGE